MISPLLPTGTLTFLFTDVEGSTRLWDQFPNEMRAAMVHHDKLIEASVTENAGALVRPRGEGDSRFAVFPRATDAVAAAGAIQSRFAGEVWSTPWSIRVRIALHTGEADLRDGDYYGTAVNRCARLRSVAYGGQTLLSQTTGNLVLNSMPPGLSLRDLGAHHLKDLSVHEHVFQLVVAGLPVQFPPLMGLEKPRSNLPGVLTSFVGREREIADLKSHVTQTRLVTITGAGGAGKTRLALQVAAGVVDAFRDGVWFVELSSIADASFVPQAVANVIGIREQQGIQITHTLLEYLLSKELLLILDNCEHLVHPVAELAEMLLCGAPALRILATSREPLGMAGESMWSIHPLSSPVPRDDLSLKDLTSYESIRLFVERAAAAKPGFTLADENARTVARICAHLDGMPLAIELAAARLRVLSLAEIERRMQDRFQLLAGGTRTAPRRHQTLRASLGWSYDLLSEPERVLFRRLAIFAGGWTLDAAESVCPDVNVETGHARLDTHDVLELLARLVDKSLVVADCESGRERYYFLEMIHQYSREHLLASGEQEQLARRHAEYFCEIAEASYGKLWGSEQGYWLARLDADNENMRAALEWSTQAKGRELILLRVAGSLWRYWEIRGNISEGRAWLERALAANPGARPYLRANAMRGAGALAGQHGDYAQAWTLHEQSLALFRECDYPPGIGRELDALGEIAGYLGDYERALDLFTASLALRRDIGDSQGVAVVLVHLADLASERGDYRRARELLEESLALNRQLQDKLYTGLTLNALGRLLLQQGECERASAFFEEALALYREMNDRLGIARSLKNLATAAKDLGDFSRAISLYSECQTIKQDLDSKRGLARSFVSLAEVALLRGDPGQSLLLCEQGLALLSGRRVRAILIAALILKAYAAYYQGDYARVATLCQEILAISAPASRRVNVVVLGIKGLLAYAQGELAEAVAAFDAAIATYREFGTRKELAFILAQASPAVFWQGNQARARQFAEESLRISQELKLRWYEARALQALGWIESRDGNAPEAMDLVQQSLAISIEQGNRRGISEALHALANLHLAQEPNVAAHLLSGSEKLRQASGSAFGRIEQQEYEAHFTAIRTTMGETAFRAAWAEGWTMTTKQVLEEAHGISRASKHG